MKKIYLLIVGLLIVIGLQAQVEKTIENTAGNLQTLLSDEELSSVSDLTIIGTMDARDFWIIKFKMPRLSLLDLSGVSIVSYKETSPSCRYDVTYPANTLPGISPYCISYNLPPLDSIILPNTLTAIGHYALGGSRITSIVIPPSVTTIEDAAFSECKSLTNITIPSSVTHMGLRVFAECSSLHSVDLPLSVSSINNETFFNCKSLTSIKIPSSITSIGDDAFYGCSSLEEIKLPPSLTFIGYEAFNGCSALTSVVIPSSVTNLGGYAFLGCTNLRTVSILPLFDELLPTTFNNCTSLSAIYFYNPTPPRIGLDDPLHGVDRSTCTLYVPSGSDALYAAALVWKDFSHIVEMAELKVSPAAITLESGQETATIAITADTEWTATSDQPWLTISHSSGTGSASVTLTAQANPTNNKRTARINFTSGNNSPDIIVTQKGIPMTIALTAGNLSSMFPTDELRNVNHLTLTGTMDARDFKFIRDELPYLIELDLTGVTITAYSGPGGTFILGQNIGDVMDENYPANGLPAMAFYNKYPILTTVKLPPTLTSIGPKAFFYCTGLTELEIPSSVTFIGNYAFSICPSLSKINIPPNLVTIAEGLFSKCVSLMSITIPSSVTSIEAYAFDDCEALTTIEIPSSVTSIGKYAFVACYNLRSITLPASLDSIKENTFDTAGLASIRIPASVKYIGTRTFFACYWFIDFYAYPVNPPDLTNTPEVFYYLDQTKCTLYVPKGSKEKYASADQWKDFTHIVEMPETQSSVLDAGVLITGVEERKESTAVKCYPNPFADQMAIEVENPSLKEVTIEIYTISGQKVKTLARALKGQELSLHWDGINENGQQIPAGMYLLKVNGQTKKVMKE